MLHLDTLPLAHAFSEAGVTAWLIGGQAVELLAGRHVRDHDDIDFLIRAADGERSPTHPKNLPQVDLSVSHEFRPAFKCRRM